SGVIWSGSTLPPRYSKARPSLSPFLVSSVNGSSVEASWLEKPCFLPHTAWHFAWPWKGARSASSTTLPSQRAFSPFLPTAQACSRPAFHDSSESFILLRSARAVSSLILPLSAALSASTHKSACASGWMRFLSQRSTQSANAFALHEA